MFFQKISPRKPDATAVPATRRLCPGFDPGVGHQGEEGGRGLAPGGRVKGPFGSRCHERRVPSQGVGRPSAPPRPLPTRVRPWMSVRRPRRPASLNAWLPPRSRPRGPPAGGDGPRRALHFTARRVTSSFRSATFADSSAFCRSESSSSRAARSARLSHQARRSTSTGSRSPAGSGRVPRTIGLCHRQRLGPGRQPDRVGGPVRPGPRRGFRLAVPRFRPRPRRRRYRVGVGLRRLRGGRARPPASRPSRGAERPPNRVRPGDEPAMSRTTAPRASSVGSA